MDSTRILLVLTYNGLRITGASLAQRLNKLRRRRRLRNVKTPTSGASVLMRGLYRLMLLSSVRQPQDAVSLLYRFLG